MRVNLASDCKNRGIHEKRWVRLDAYFNNNQRHVCSITDLCLFRALPISSPSTPTSPESSLAASLAFPIRACTKNQAVSWYSPMSSNNPNHYLVIYIIYLDIYKKNNQESSAVHGRYVHPYETNVSVERNTGITWHHWTHWVDFSSRWGILCIFLLTIGGTVSIENIKT